MKSIWIGLAPSAQYTRLLAMRGASDTLLKGRLTTTPASPLALQSLLEAVALWEGRQVRAALVVDESDRGSATSLCRAAFPDFGRTPLYTLDHVMRRIDDRAGREHDAVAFRSIARLLIEEVAR